MKDFLMIGLNSEKNLDFQSNNTGFYVQKTPVSEITTAETGTFANRFAVLN